MSQQRCPWACASQHEVHYHDQEWGIPVNEDQALFELLTLEGAQAGLSWSTILQKRAGYRQVFKHFDVNAVAAMTASELDQAMQDSRIVRHRLKIQATVNNARCVQQLQQTHNSFSEFIWSFVNGQPVQNAWTHASQVPVSTPVSEQMSKALKQQGFKFVGPTICYAFMQAAGLVNDHLTDCFRYSEVGDLRSPSKPRVKK